MAGFYFYLIFFLRFCFLFTLFGNAFCADCFKSVTPIIHKTSSPPLNSNYNIDNIGYSSTIPWVGSGRESWFSLRFPYPVIIKQLLLKGGKVDINGDGKLEDCYVTRFAMHYTVENGETKKYPKVKDNTGLRYVNLSISDPVTNINITIKKYVGCAAVNLDVLSCGHCSRLPNINNQILTCSDDFQKCTYKCKSGYEMRNKLNDGVRMCQLNGAWSGANISCVDVNECKNNVCGRNEECINKLGTYRCNCMEGYTGKPCEDINECNGPNICNVNANCINIEGSYKCQCKDGYRGDGLNNCNDINECNGPSNCHVNAYCTNTDGSYKCACNNGFSGDGKRKCEDINECDADPNICNVNAYCTNTEGSYKCQCKDGYRGDGLNNCNDINECNVPGNCHVNANCTNTEGSYKCACNNGFSGDGKTKCEDIDECEVGSFNCDVNAKCINLDGSYKCMCKNGYSGDGKTNCVDIDECSEKKDNCSDPPRANCTNIPGGFNCECLPGYKGDGVMCRGRTVEITDFKPETTNVILRYGKRLDLFCHAEGLPKPSITWHTPNDDYPAKEGVSFFIEHVKLTNSGVYKCIANNNETKDSLTFNLTVDGRADPPSDVTVQDIRDNSATVTWSKPIYQGADAITGYKVVYKQIVTQFVSEISSYFTEITLRDLTPNKEYEVWVVSINAHGSSRRGNSGKFSTLAEEPVKMTQPKAKEGSTTSSSVKIQLMKHGGDNVKIQIIAEKNKDVSTRKRREPPTLPDIIQGYEQERCNATCVYIAAEVENNFTEFVVGDGEMYGKYENVELLPETSYYIYARGVSYNDKMEPNFGKPSDPLKISTKGVDVDRKSGGNVVGIAVGVTISLLLVIALVFLGVIYYRSRQQKIVEIDPETGEKKEPNSELLPLTKKGNGKRKNSQVEDGTPDPNHPPIHVSGFAKYVGKLHKSDDRGFMIQYNTLEPNKTYTSDFATSPENKDKNRYANIIAYDHSRVHLKQLDDDDSKTYINASFIDGYNSANAYIATQGPLSSTFNDFWRMIWEKSVSAIVMLTNLQERHKLKCHKYWPEDSESYDQIIVTGTRREQYADYVIRTFLLKNETDEEREVKQFHFTVWPDHGVPEYPTALLAFQRRVRAYSSRDYGPLAVHCSAGVGRSGTFIVIDAMLSRIQNEETIDIYNYVRYLRTRRMHMVQTEEQYVFCHDALLESILCGNTEIAAHNLRIEMNKLRQKDPTTKSSGYESQFKTLSRVSPSLPKESFTVATKSENVSKNRFHGILASDHGRVILDENDDKCDGPYINAVFLDGYKQQNAFIVTQAPLKETICDFWHMLYDKRSACVVVFINLDEEEGDFPEFWPAENSQDYGEFNVELMSDASRVDAESEDKSNEDDENADMIERKFKITKNEDKPFKVKMFQHLSWKETSVPTDVSMIISLIQSIEKWQQHSGNGPITIVCNDGQGRSGTFAALCSVLERVKIEQVVDVFQTVKALRIQRPGVVKHVDQYEFIYVGVQEYLDSFSDYANFKQIE
ncbi:receptor-type tyrosine-protein phosphatase delta-like isoform X2 [Xenia sp. Carnegie-2017]|uniref:receptor-type tyrosine-protein phosphatase delta-like isoform X2 n=1 Tax=Xenia sp. Carnegie-2017 TaxID=2897299 RepID=UPI001F036D7C|nr:receptor-type tyrosine-protein phosphatase delta-like isoform X2 [Xenia sp. Carnegie-2017]